MPKHSLFSLAFAVSAAVVLSQTAFGAPLDYSVRDVLFLQEAAPQSALNKKSVGKSSAPENVLTFSVEITEQQRENWCGLLTPGDYKPIVVINDRKLDIDPVHRKDGMAFLIPGGYLQTGTNDISVLRADDDPSTSWDGVVLFTLAGTTEQVHFAQMFGEKEEESEGLSQSVKTAQAPIMAMQLPADYRQAYYDVLSYDCSWTPSFYSSRLNAASMTMQARSLNSSLQTVVLDFHNNGGAMDINYVDRGPGTNNLNYSLDSGNKRLLVTLPSSVPNGNIFTVRVNYDGVPGSRQQFGNPYVRSTHGPNNQTVIYTFSEPYGARYWWPCKDLPDDKADNGITERITVPSGQNWEVVSNGELTSVVNNGNGTETWTWTENFPISTYLVSMCISNYTYSSATYISLNGTETMPIKHAIYPENTGYEGNAAAGTLDVMNYFADVFGEYPFLSEKYYTASHNISSGMEHQTCTSVPGYSLGNGTLRQNVHELAHQWFGDKVTCRTFDHLWLNEGFATYAEALWVQHTDGSAAYRNYVADWNPTQSTPVVSENADDFYQSVVYQKGAWILHMLRRVLGDTDFFQTLRSYLVHSQLAYGTAVSQDFENIAEDVSGKNLTSFFSQWLYRPGGGEPSAQPTYSFSAGSHVSGGDNIVDLHIDQLQSGTPFVMPLDIQGVNASGSKQIRVVQNSLGSSNYDVNFGSFVPLEINFDPDNWVLKDMSFSINSCGLPAASAGSYYSRGLRASYGNTPYSWNASGLPSGMSLSNGGTLSGTPSAAGNYSINISCTDDNNNTRATTLDLVVGGGGGGGSDIIVDNNDPGFSSSSNWATGTSAVDKYGSNYRFHLTAPVSDTAEWAFNIPSSGNYEIYAWWSQGTNRATNAAYILPTGSVARVNQQANGGQWNSLGIHNLSSGSNKVRLSCWTTAGYVVIADAVKISPR